MLTLDEFKLWLQRMGYYKELPTNLEQIWNRQTSHIFEQMVMNTRPRNDIETIRKNIIINRLKHKQSPINRDLYPYEPIRIYKENRTVQQQIDILRNNIKEICNKIEEYLKKNKSEYIQLDHLKQEIGENEEKTFILRRKYESIRKQIDNVENMVVSISKYTNANNQLDEQEIRGILKEFMEKLQTINMKYKNIPSLYKLFNTTKQDNSTIMKRSFLNSTSYFSSTPSNTKKMPTITPIINNNQRESLGLLPDSCIDELDDIYLEQPLSISKISSINGQFQENSIHDSLSTTINSNLEANNSNHFDHFILEKLLKNREINTILMDLLNNSNHSLIFHLWENHFNGLLTELNDSYLEFNNISKTSNCDLKKDNEIELNFNHVKIGIAIWKKNMQIKKLEDLFNQQKIKIRHPVPDTIKLQIADYKLDKQIKYLQEKKDFLQKQQLSSTSLLSTSNSYNLQKINEQINTTKKQILIKLRMIEDNISSINRIIYLIKKNIDETNLNVEKFQNFILDENWFLPLLNNYTTVEMGNLIDFPLQFYKNYPSDNYSIPFYINSINLPKLNQFLSALEYYLNDETIISEQIRAKFRLQLLKSLLDEDEETVSNRQNQLVKLDFTDSVNEMESLERLLGKRVDSLFGSIRKTVELWPKLPFGDYLSDERLINGYPYQYYKKLLKDRQEYL